MDRKALLAFLGLGALALAIGGCTDAGDPEYPAGQAANATITVTDLVGDWSSLTLDGPELSPVTMTADGNIWSATVTGLQPGTYQFGIYPPDKEGELATGSFEVGTDYQVSGDSEVTIAPAAGTGFNMTVENHNPAYDNIRIKGSMNGWSPAITGHSADNVHWFLHFAAGAVAAGDYEWGVIQDDGSEFGIWLLPSGQPNLQFTVGEDGVPTGTVDFTIPEPAPVIALTLNCDMNAYAEAYNLVQVRGAFNGWSSTPVDMADADDDGIYTVVVEAPQNTVNLQFKFLLDGGLYESVPAECGVDDGFGGRNRWVDTGTAPITYTAPFSGCPE